MIPIVTPEEMRAIDAAAPEPVDVLIDRAGRAVARCALEMLGGAYGRRVVVLAGRGNNGADGRVAADVLRRRGVNVQVVEAADAPAVIGPDVDLVIDAAFGTGFHGTWAAPEPGVAFVLAVDIPSGVDASTGSVSGNVLAADRTATFEALKPGLLFGDGAELSGQIDVVHIGLSVASQAHYVERSDVSAWWPLRPRDSHKWNGAVRVVAGSPGMIGAARLCAASAARAGAGLVALSSPGIDAGARDEILQPTLPSGPWHDELLGDLDRFASLAIGPGLGRSQATRDGVLRTLAASSLPTVVDGDGLWALRDGSVDRPHGAVTVLTPHDGEFAMLSGQSPGTDRIAAARGLASSMDCTVLLKGPTSVVADANGDVLVVDRGDDRLATAGSGDVLTGIVAALLASGVEPLRAAAAAAWIHGEAGSLGLTRGLLAGDLVELVGVALARLG